MGRCNTKSKRFAGAHVNHGHISDDHLLGWRLSESRNRQRRQQKEIKQTNASHRIPQK
jgi:hypothetical protein